MTSIAWDGVTLAADSLVNDDGLICRTDYNKIRKINGVKVRGHALIAYALAGDMYAHDFVEVWVKKGCPVDELSCPISFSGILITEKYAYEFDENGGLYKTSDKAAIGSGSHLCKSAMHLGLSAKEAVKHAANIDLYTGGAIRSVKCR